MASRNNNINNITTDEKYKEYSSLAYAYLQYLENERNDLEKKEVITIYLNKIMVKLKIYNDKIKKYSTPDLTPQEQEELDKYLLSINNNSSNSNNRSRRNTKKSNASRTKSMGISKSMAKDIKTSLELKEIVKQNELKRKALAKFKSEEYKLLQKRLTNLKK